MVGVISWSIFQICYCDCFPAQPTQWLQGVDIFAKDFLVFPYHQDLHWSIFLLCYPGIDRDGRCRRACLLHLDSLHGASLFKLMHGADHKCWIMLGHLQHRLQLGSNGTRDTQMTAQSLCIRRLGQLLSLVFPLQGHDVFNSLQ